MKTMKMTLAAVAMFITTMTMQAQPMSYYAMRENARFLTDRMAYTLGIATSLLDDLYMINYDYICGVNDYLDDVAYGYHYDDYMAVLYARDAALRRLLTPYQWSRLIALDYFYRPISFVNRRWSFSIYAYDPYRTHFYYGVPHRYDHYRGGHFFRGMAPAGGHMGPHGGPGYHIGGQPNRPQHGNNPRHDDNRGYNGGSNYGGGYNGGSPGNTGGGAVRHITSDGSIGNVNRGTSNVNMGGGATRNVGSSTPHMNERPSSTRQVGGSEIRTSSAGRSVSSTPVRSVSSSPVRSTSSSSSDRSSTSGGGRGSTAGSRGGGRR
ncbi:MAG: hypothetical protein K5778_07835 [Bacteroidaceae bacterium]|nr:hypothetical protein [Bacteroidaceae bacterium]